MGAFTINPARSCRIAIHLCRLRMPAIPSIWAFSAPPARGLEISYGGQEQTGSNRFERR